MPKNNNWLSKKDYQTALRSLPIVSVDLIINNNEGQILLGKRINEPAKNRWFVPGGRLFKYETIPEAVKRISFQELGQQLEYGKGIGIYHQNYPNNFADNSHGSHYITFAISIPITTPLIISGDDQHEEFRWWPIYELMSSNQVHEVTKKLFSLRTKKYSI